MESKSIFPKGLLRSTPDSATVDGALLEAINTRFRDGARKVVGGKVVESYSLTNLDANAQEVKVYHHPESNLYVCVVKRNDSYSIEIWDKGPTGGYRKNFYSDPISPVERITIGSNSSDCLINHIGNFVHVSSQLVKQSWVLYWDPVSLSYVELPALAPLKFACGTVNNTKLPVEVDTTGLTTDEEKYNAIIGQFTKVIAEQKKLGFVNGHLSFRYAYKLFDGSYVMHSNPFYVKCGYVYRDVSSGEVNGLEVRLGATARILNDDTSADEGVVFDQVKLYLDATGILSTLNLWDSLNLIQSVCIFSSSIEEGYTVPETMSGLITHVGTYFPYSSDVSKIVDPQSLFLVKEFKVSELQDVTTFVIEDYTSIELNEGISIDNFTHHTYIPGCEYAINNKLHLGDVLTIPSSPLDNAYRKYFSVANSDIIPDSDIANLICNEVVTPSELPTDFEVHMTVELITDSGIVKRSVQIYDNFYEKDYIIGGITLTSISLLLNPVIIYPDSRARKLHITCRNTSNGYTQTLHTYELTPSSWGNFSYSKAVTSPFYKYCDFILLNNETFVRTATANTDQIGYLGTIRDYNRVQVSRLNNPFVFPAENSYRFGSENNRIIGMITAQEPITETVFSQYPVNVFTFGGIYALQQGSGDVLYSNVVELNKEVLSNPKGLLGLSGAIVFVTKEGLKLLQGRQVTDLSLEVRGDTTNSFASNIYIEESLNDSRVCQLSDKLSDSFLEYIQDSILGHSNVFNEIVVSNPSKGYSYVYNLETKSWHTISESWSQFPAYKNGLFSDINQEGDSLHHYIQTRPFFLSDAGFKKINGMLVRSEQTIAQNEFDCVVLFGSNDAKTFEAIGKVVIINETTAPVIRNTPGYYRYFSLAIVGKSADFKITSIDIQFSSRYNNKIR